MSRSLDRRPRLADKPGVTGSAAGMTTVLRNNAKEGSNPPFSSRLKEFSLQNNTAIDRLIGKKHMHVLNAYTQGSNTKHEPRRNDQIVRA